MELIRGDGEGRRRREKERREEERELPVSAKANPALQMIRTDDMTQDGSVVPVRLLVAHQERVVLPWINLRANRWRTPGDIVGDIGHRWRLRWRLRWQHGASLAITMSP